MLMRKSSGYLVMAAALAAGMTMSAVSGTGLLAQARGVVLRTLTGTVQDKGGAGIKGAVVYLKDTHTSTVRTAICEESGNYRFVQLSPSTDYEVYAKVGDKTSKTRSISSFDSKNEFTINLKID